MSTFQVKVGLPIEGPRVKNRMRWSPAEQRRAPFTSRARRPLTVRERGAASQPVAAAAISEKPLTFLSAKSFFVMFAAAALAIALAAFTVRSNHLAVSHSYEISELTQHKMELLEINRQLKTELAQVGSLEHLERAARESLGLIRPQKGQIVVIE